MTKPPHLVEAMGELTPFGKYAQYLLILGISKHAREINNKRSQILLAQAAKKAHQQIDAKNLSKYGAPNGLIKGTLNVDDLVTHLSAMRKVYNSKVKNDPSIPKDEKTIFTKALRYIKDGKYSTASAKKAVGKLAYLLSAKLGKVFDELVHGNADEDGITIKKDSVDGLYSTLRTAVADITGTAGLTLTTEQLRNAKGDKALSKSARSYTEAKKAITEKFTVVLRNLTSEKPMDADKLRIKMKSLGFVDRRFPTSKQGFKGMVGFFEGKMALFSNEGRRLSSGIPAEAKIKMNPKYNPEEDNAYILKYTAPNAHTETRIYTQSKRAANTAKKFEAVDVGMADVKKWVRTWKKNTADKNLMISVPATAAYILYLTGARVGTSQKNQAVKTGIQSFGITTLRKEHVDITASRIRFRYIGKKGMRQEHIIKTTDQVTKRLAKNLTKLLKGKEDGDLVFSFTRPTSRNGAEQRLNTAFFRSYLKSTGMSIKPHSLRHIRGTSLVVDLLKKKKFSPSKAATTLSKKQKEAEAFMKEKILIPAAKLLGHKSISKGVETPAWSTTIQSYLKIDVVEKWFTQNQLQTPTWVTKVKKAAA